MFTYYGSNPGWENVKSYAFNGTASAYFQTPNGLGDILDMGAGFSVVCWFKGTTEGTQYFSNYLNGGHRGVIEVNNSNNIRIAWRYSNQRCIANYSNLTWGLLDGEWHQIAVVFEPFFNANGITVYVDGVVNSGISISQNEAQVNFTGGNLQIGGNPAFTAFEPHNLDEILIFNTNISAVDAARLYNSGTVFNYSTDPTYSNAVRFYRADDNLLPVVSDIKNSTTATAFSGVSLDNDVP